MGSLQLPKVGFFCFCNVSCILTMKVDVPVFLGTNMLFNSTCGIKCLSLSIAFGYL